MANKFELSAQGVSQYPAYFKRQGPFPLDVFGLHYSLSSAQNYALSAPESYIGEIVTVVDEELSTVSTYKIQTDGSLGQIDSDLSSTVHGSEFITVAGTENGIAVSLKELSLDGGNAGGDLS